MKIPNTRRQLQSINIIIKSVTLPLLLISITTMLSSKALQFPNELASSSISGGSSSSSNNKEQAEVEHSINVINKTFVSGSQLPLSTSLDSSSLVPTNFYSNLQAQKFRVNVSNICERNQMRATIRINRPFYGLIHTKDKRRRPACSLEGNGEQSYAIEIGYTLNPSDPNHCGVVSHQLPAARNLTTTSNQNQQQQASNQAQLTLSVVLVVRLHKNIEFSDDRYFLLSCANRCVKPDCSPTGTNSLQEDSSSRLLASSPLQSQAPNRNPFVASESILSSSSMALRNNNNLPDKSISNNNNNNSRAITLTEVRPVNHLWPTEKCDTMLDMKFQWLVKLCWVLSTLLGVILCAILYMCLNLSQRSKSSRSNNTTGDNKRTSSNRTNIGKLNSQRNKTLDGNHSNLMGSTKINQVIYSPPIQTENITWEGAQTSLNNPNENHHHHLVNQMRDDNNNIYLAKQQQQQLMFANSLNLIPNQHQSSHYLVLGRSAELANGFGSGSGHPVKQPLAARVKRRRSIGSSMAPGYRGQNDSSDKSASYHLNGTGTTATTNSMQAARFLLASQRAKSRSQTTIYYDQGQDPFQTIPFNNYSHGSNNANHHSNYQTSDSENSNRVYLASEFAGTEVYGMPTAAATARTPLESRLQTFAINQNTDELSVTHSMPQEEVAHMVIPTSGANNHSPPSNTTGTNNSRQDMSRKQQGLRTSHLKGSSFIAPPQVETIQVQAARKPISQPQQQQPISQFDPQNSRQLIDLIQHKHRQQMEEANLTAANLQTSEMFLEIQRQRQQQNAPQNTPDQRNPLNGRPPWR